jgi:hypothetical protein
MINIRETVQTPSRALEYMIKGLLKQSKRRDFKIRMSTFGYFDKNDKVCFGCAATCTVQAIAKKNLTAETIFWQAETLKFKSKELVKFEIVMDCARQGQLEPLFSFFKMEYPEIVSDYLEAEEENGVDWYLGSSDWRKLLPNYKRLAAFLKEAGF